MSAECTWWKSQVVIHTSISTLLAVIWFIQLLRTIHAEAETLNMQAGQDAGYFSSLVNPFQYEEGRSEQKQGRNAFSCDRIFQLLEH